MPASPRGSFALARSLVAGVRRIGRRAAAHITPSNLRMAQLITSIVLTGCAGFEIWFGGRPYAFVLLSGALVMALAVWRQGETVETSPADAPQPNALEALQSEIVMQLAAQANQHAQTRSTQTLSGEAWGDLMARVSHDLRTPLNAVIGFSDVMGSELFGPVGDARYRDYIAHIRDSGRELLKSAEDTLAITSLLGANRAGNGGDAINLEALACEAGRAAAAQNIDIAIDDTLDVIAERRGLRQALVNLVSEARRRGTQDGSIQVSATCEDEFVIVQVETRVDTGRPTLQEASLHVCMARVLLELQGSRLIEIERDGTWKAVTVLGRASQQDFFAAGSVPMGWRPRAQLPSSRIAEFA